MNYCINKQRLSWSILLLCRSLVISLLPLHMLLQYSMKSHHVLNYLFSLSGCPGGVELRAGQGGAQ